MEKIKPRTLSGFMELLPQRQMQMERFMEVLRESYSLYGFTPLDTPVIEAAQVLLAKGGGETEKQIYRFEKGDSDLALRFDLTVPLAKYVAQHYGELTFPFRRFQIGKVYRGERAQRGRFREFYQADIDIIGDGQLDILNEAEIPAVICRTFTALGLKGFEIRVNNRKILNGFYAMEGLTDKAADIMRTADKLEKIGPAKVRGIFTEDLGLTEEQDYYTGTVYETCMKSHPEIGSICSGGRYDNLAEYYTDKKLPGVGISIGVTRLFYVLEEQGMLNDLLVTAPADVLVLPMSEDLSPAIRTATALREAGIRTQLYTEKKKFKARMAYADRLSIPYVLFLGEDEIQSGTVTCKDMTAGTQQTLPLEELLPQLKEALARRRAQALITE